MAAVVAAGVAAGAAGAVADIEEGGPRAGAMMGRRQIRSVEEAIMAGAVRAEAVGATMIRWTKLVELIYGGRRMTAKEAVDWGALVARLEALVQKWPAIASLLAALVHQFQGDQVVTPSALAKAAAVKCEPGCFDEVLDGLEDQQQDLVKALCANVCAIKCLECCQPGDGPY